MGSLTLAGAGSPTSIIKSIQHVQITIAASTTSNTATINSVNTNYTAILFSGCQSGTSTSCADSFTRVVLTDATTVTATRNTSNTNTTTVSCAVIEFQSWALASNVQRGTISIASASASNTATISSVTTSRAVVLRGGYTTNNGAITASVYTNLELTNGTTVTAARDSTTGTVIAAYSVVEFASNLVKSVQHRSVTMATSSSSPTDTISSVAFDNTWFIYNGGISGISAPNSALHGLFVNRTTTVTLIREGVSTTSRTVKYIVLEFVPGITRRTYYSSQTLSGSTSNSLDLSAIFKSDVDRGKTASSHLGQTFTGSSTTVMGQWLTALDITNTTTQTVAKGVSTGSVITYFEVLEFL